MYMKTESALQCVPWVKCFFFPQRHSVLSLFQGSGGVLRKQVTAPSLCVCESGHAGQHTAELDQNQLIPVTHNLFTLIIIIWQQAFQQSISSALLLL